MRGFATRPDPNSSTLLGFGILTAVRCSEVKWSGVQCSAVQRSRLYIVSRGREMRGRGHEGGVGLKVRVRVRIITRECTSERLSRGIGEGRDISEG